jgi:pentatricopeptide repeat protein
MIHCFGRKGDIKRMLTTFNLMKEFNITPNQHIYNLLIDTMGKNRKIDYMEKLFQEMKDREIQVRS